MHQFVGSKYCVHYGGGFFASNRLLAERFSDECGRVYEEMISRNFMTNQGDEFITSVAAYRMKQYVKNAGAYVFRYWTGSFRFICNNYRAGSVVVLHLPAEKEQGLLKLYDRFVSKGHVPSNKVVWSITHLNHRSIRVVIGRSLRLIWLIR